MNPHHHTHLLESWNNLLEVVEDSSNIFKGTSLECPKELSKLNSQLYLEFELWIQGYDSCCELLIGVNKYFKVLSIKRTEVTLKRYLNGTTDGKWVGAGDPRPQATLAHS